MPQDTEVEVMKSTSGKYDKVQSKLLEPTTAYNVQKTGKYKDKPDSEEGSTKITKKITSESHLLQPTAALINGTYRRDTDDDDSSKQSSVRGKPAKVSDRLLEPTAANLSARYKFEESKNEDPDDIWWEQRTSTKKEAVEKAPEVYKDVPSKYLEPTTAYAAMKTNKYEKGPSGYEPSPLPREIDPDSHLLSTTTAMERGSYFKQDFLVEGDEETEEVMTARRLSQLTGPKDVESRLYESTSAIRNGMWKPKDFREAEEEMRQEEEAVARGETLKVSGVSDRLLEPTAANENARYNKVIEADPREQGWKPNSKKPVNTLKPLPGQESNSTLKVKETSAHLLEPTASNEHGKWKGTAEYTWTNKEKDQEIKIGEHLLEPTAALINGKYQRRESNPDAREVGWKPDLKPSKDLFELNEPAPAFLSTTKKVDKPSEHILTPTAAIENGKWRRQSDAGLGSSGSIDGKSDTENEKKKVNIKPVNSDEHFLSPTTATKLGAYKKPDEEEKSESPQKKLVKEPSQRLLAPTANNQFDHWKNRPKREVPAEELLPAKVPITKKVTASEHFLTPTTATINGSTKPVLKRIESLSNPGSPKADRSESPTRSTREVSVKRLVRKFSLKSVDDNPPRLDEALVDEVAAESSPVE